MKLRAAAVFCVTAMGLFGCAADASVDDASSDDALKKTGASATETLRCSADSSDVKLALVAAKGGKFTLLTLKPAADLYAVTGSTGTLTSSSSGRSWKGGGASLSLGKNLKGKWEDGGKSTDVTCSAAADETASWKTASALVDYASEIDGLADAVLENSEDPKPKPYAFFVVETNRRSELALGQVATKTSGALPGDDDAQSLLDDDDFGYGPMNAAYSLGGGDDYGEWFQGASDGISLSGDVLPALGGGAKAGFVAREKVTALASLVDSAKPSAVEITVGAWTFFLPDAFAK